MGWIYRRKKRDPETKQLKETGPYWIGYFIDGHPRREGTGTWKHKEAERILKEREGRVATGQPILPKVDRVRVEELLDDLRAHYQTTGCRNLKEAEDRLVPLRDFFTGRRAGAVSGAVLTEYIHGRQAEGKANATINRELAMLGTAFKLGEEQNKVVRRPIIHLLKEPPPRAGFFEEAQYHAVRRGLPEDLQVAVTMMYTYGWRLKEVITLTLSQVDLDAGTVRLTPGSTKNKDGRVVCLSSELTLLLSAQITKVKALSRRLGRVLPALFTHLTGRYTGQPRRDFRTAWESACDQAGLPGFLKHDFRRTAVRNMERAGIARSIAMKITGHKTESVYKRYAIVNEADLLEATRKLTGTLPRTKPVQSAPHPAQSVDSPPLTVQNR